jgi:hypothetical protein
MKSTIKTFFEKLDNRSYFAIAGIAIVVIIIAIVLFKGSTSIESYKQVSGGAAGLQATIEYDCAKDKCDADTKFDFNVYIFKEDGQLTNVVRPDKDGKVNIALLGGNYVLLIGKKFGDVFPQEQIVLKNGQELELKLHYK